MDTNPFSSLLEKEAERIPFKCVIGVNTVLNQGQELQKYKATGNYLSSVQILNFLTNNEIMLN